MNKRAALVTNKPLGFSGGVERFTFYLDRLLRNRGYQVDIYHTENIPLRRTYDGSFAINRLTYAVSSYVRKYKRDYDIIISNGGFGWGIGRPHPGQRFYNVYHGTAAGLTKATRHLHNYKSYFRATYLTDGLVERLSGIWKTRIAVSESVKNEVRREYGLAAVAVNNGIDTEHFKLYPDKQKLRAQYDIPAAATVGLFAGRADVIIKGMDRLQEIIRRLPEVFWLLVLGGDSSGLRLALPGQQVKIVNNAVYELMPDLYNTADFALYLSRYEGNAYYLLEALACQVPVIATPAGAAREIYQDDILQQLFLPRGADYSGLIEDVVQRCALCRNREIAGRIGERGQAIIEEKYSLPAWERSMAAVLMLG